MGAQRAIVTPRCVAQASSELWSTMGFA